MALVVPNIESSPTFDAQSISDSTDFTALQGTDLGTGVVSGCAVSQHTGSDMEVTVAAGSVRVAGLTYAVASAQVTISAADATDRRDIIVYTVGTGLQAIKGTDCGTAGWTKSQNPSTNPPPVKPNIPASSVLLGEVYVASTTTVIANTNVIDKTAIVSSSGLGVFGDGSDGTATCDGSTPVTGMTLSGGNYTLTRDVFFAALTINSGVIVKPAGFRLFVQGTLTNNGTISNNGNAGAAAGTGGAAIANTGTIGAVNYAAGGASTTSGGAAGGSAAGGALGGTGGKGGASLAEGGGANGGNAAAPPAAYGSIRSVPTAVLGMLLGVGISLNPNGGAGGGAGYGDGSTAGGGGGGGGGAVVVVAQVISGTTGAIQARGGAGGSPTTGNGGSGAGGGGGWVVVISSSVAGAAVVGQTIDAQGGTGGAAHGTGSLGGNGSAGTVILIPN